MTSTISSSHAENNSPGFVKPALPPMAAPSPRKALGELSANTLISPYKPVAAQGSAKTLKRPSMSALNDDKSFQYLKRRKVSVTPQSAYPQIPSSSPNPRPLHSPFVTSAQGPILPPTSMLPTPLHRSRYNAEGIHSSDEDTALSAQSQRSFASLIDYDPSSQTSATPSVVTARDREIMREQEVMQTGKSPGPPGVHSSAVGSCTVQRLRAQGQSRRRNPVKVEILRARLRVALYKVLTRQIHTPFSRLQLKRNVIPRVRPLGGEIGEKADATGRGRQAPKRKSLHRSKASEMFGPALDEIIAAKNRQMSSGEETIVVASDEGGRSNINDDDDDDDDNDDTITPTAFQRASAGAL